MYYIAKVWNRLYIFLFFVICLGASSILSAATIHVDINDSSNYDNIQPAIDSAADGDTIIVMPGRYYEKIDLMNKAVTLQSSSPSDSSIISQTIIDGNKHGPVVSCKSGEGSGTVINGFVITNAEYGNGAGMYILNSSPEVMNCTFSSNSGDAGAGIYNDNSSPVISNCTFSVNSAGGGGAIANINSSAPKISKCVFVSNHGFVYGGAVLNFENTAPTIIDCEFIGNSSEKGGAIVNYEASAAISLSDFTGNSATYDGGAIYNISDDSTITACVFYANSAGIDGGGIYNDELSTPAITSCKFNANTAGSLGGGICDDLSNFSTVTYCSFCDNIPQNIGREQIPLGPTNFVGHCAIALDNTAIVGDLDNDGDVDILDFATLAQNWLTGVR